MRKIVRYPNKILRRKTREVKVDELKDPKIKRLVLDMIQAMEEENGIGLAAPQVGSSLKICMVKNGDKVLVLVNPKIKLLSKRTDIFEEGCLSFPGQFYPVERPIKVKVQARNMDGEKIRLKADGLLSRALQHEIDHLNGILIIDRAKK